MRKKLGLGCLAVGFLGAGAGAIAWWQVTQLPSWYRPTATPITATPVSAEQFLTQKVDQSLAAQQSSPQASSAAPTPSTQLKTVAVRLTEQDINQVAIAKATELIGSPTLPPAVKGINTAIKPNKIESGAIVNLSQLASEPGLPTHQQQLLQKATKAFPALANRDVYIGIEGQPTLHNGQLHLDPQTRVKIGNMTATLSDVAARLGVSPATLEQKLFLALPLEGAEAQSLTLGEQQAELETTVEPCFPNCTAR